jgi:hypothetical protein
MCEYKCFTLLLFLFYHLLSDDFTSSIRRDPLDLVGKRVMYSKLHFDFNNHMVTLGVEHPEG